ncbi:MAG: phage protein Gp36 family protein [Aquabacterium sp.]
MTYATKQDMLDRYGEPRMRQLTDVGQPQSGAVVDSVLNARLADADAEIDGYLAGRMAVPLASPPAIVRLLACRLAYGMLLGEAAADADIADVRAARDYLQQVALGRINLTTPEATPAPGGLGSVLFDTGAKVMGREAADTQA